MVSGTAVIRSAYSGFVADTQILLTFVGLQSILFPATSMSRRQSTLD